MKMLNPELDQLKQRIARDKVLNPELEQLEQRIAPDLISIGGGVIGGVGVGIGTNDSTGSH